MLILAVVVIAGGLGGWYLHQSSGTVSSKPQRPVYVEKKHVKLVAVGDSLTHGQGDEQNNGGYVGLIKGKIEHRYHKTTVTTVNYGVSGDRSDQILDRLNSQKKMRADLRKADVITMTVGGNDLMQNFEKDALDSPKKISQEVDQAAGPYRHHLHQLFNAIRKQNSRAPIFVMSIYNPFYVYFPSADTITNSIAKWNRTTRSVMADYHQMYFVNINQLMSHGQYKTKKQRSQLVAKEKQVNQGKVRQRQLVNIMNEKNHNMNAYITTDDNFHPNHRGYEQICNQLFKAMVKHDRWEYVRR